MDATGLEAVVEHTNQLKEAETGEGRGQSINRVDAPKSAIVGSAPETPRSEVQDLISVDNVAERLSLAIDRASEASQWTVVERLSEQLERHQLRQLEAQAENVTRLPRRTDRREGSS